MLVLWDKLKEDLIRRLAVNDKVTKRQVEDIAFGKDKRVHSSEMHVRLFGAVDARLRVRLSASAAKATLRSNHLSKTNTLNKMLTPWVLKTSRTLLVVAAPVKARVAERLRHNGYKIAEGSQGAVDPDVRVHGDTVELALAAIWQTLSPDQKRRAAA